MNKSVLCAAVFTQVLFGGNLFSFSDRKAAESLRVDASRSSIARSGMSRGDSATGDVAHTTNTTRLRAYDTVHSSSDISGHEGVGGQSGEDSMMSVDASVLSKPFLHHGVPVMSVQECIEKINTSLRENVISGFKGVIDGALCEVGKAVVVDGEDAYITKRFEDVLKGVFLSICEASMSKIAVEDFVSSVLSDVNFRSLVSSGNQRIDQRLEAYSSYVEKYNDISNSYNVAMASLSKLEESLREVQGSLQRRTDELSEAKSRAGEVEKQFEQLYTFMSSMCKDFEVTESKYDFNDLGSFSKCCAALEEALCKREKVLDRSLSDVLSKVKCKTEELQQAESDFESKVESISLIKGRVNSLKELKDDQYSLLKSVSTKIDSFKSLPFPETIKDTLSRLSITELRGMSDDKLLNIAKDIKDRLVKEDEWFIKGIFNITGSDDDVRRKINGILSGCVEDINTALLEAYGVSFDVQTSTPPSDESVPDALSALNKKAEDLLLQIKESISKAEQVINQMPQKTHNRDVE